MSELWEEKAHMKYRTSVDKIINDIAWIYNYRPFKYKYICKRFFCVHDPNISRIISKGNYFIVKLLNLPNFYAAESVGHIVFDMSICHK